MAGTGIRFISRARACVAVSLHGRAAATAMYPACIEQAMRATARPGRP